MLSVILFCLAFFCFEEAWAFWGYKTRRLDMKVRRCVHVLMAVIYFITGVLLLGR